MRTTALRVLCLGLIVAGSGLLVASAKATGSHPEGPQRCSLATFKGFYVFSAEGFDATADQKLAVAGYEIYDGDGHVHGVVTTSAGGTISSDVPFTGTYTVSHDCSGTVTLREKGATEDLHFDQFILPSGDRFRFVETDDGIILSGTETRDDGDDRRSDE